MSLWWIFVFAVVVLGYFLFRQPAKDIKPDMFAHWIKGFMRTRKNGGSLTISHATTPGIFVRLTIANGNDHRCDLVIEVVNGNIKLTHFSSESAR